MLDDWGYPDELAWVHAAATYDVASRLAQHLSQYEFIDAHMESIRGVARVG